jgi:hypothetical protein
MVALVGFMGLAIDMGYLRLVKRKMQSAADSAAIAGASQLKIGGVTAAAQADAARDGYTDGTNGVVVTVNTPTSGSHIGASFVEVIVSQPQPTFFMKIFGVNSAAMSARAVATLGSSTTGCMYALSPSGTAITVGNVDLEAPTCGIISNSGLTVSGASHQIEAASIGVAGSYVGPPPPAVGPKPKEGIAQVSDPLGYLTPPAVGACTKFPSSSTVNPGTYCDITINSGTVTFNPGLYITTGGMSIKEDATVAGSAITIFVDSGSVNFENKSTVELSAPTSGPYAGILFWQNPADTSLASLLGELSGALYFPKAPLNLGSINGTNYTIIVADTINFQGNSTIGSNYSSLANGSPVKAAVLVE